MGRTRFELGFDKLRPLFKVRYTELFDSVKATFHLKNEREFDDLYDLLFGYACRDQEGEPDDPAPDDLTGRRAEGFRLAQQMRDNAAAMISSLEMIYKAHNRFNGDVVKWNPSLLSEIFDVDLGPPTNIFLPNSISILQTFFGGPDWDAADAKLSALAALPIKQKLSTGPVANVLLRGAVKACRLYWRDVEMKSWSMSALKHYETRKENRRELLQGECEIFVASMLEAAGIRFTLQELSSAWLAVDRSQGADERQGF